ncbi:MAG TPA: hydantoinase B/oxoprolinase family protein [Solirubrobacteraceae bacterium]|jgi:N-methylhydantoinase B|nr:hydantoinase B/oxoprolinase family protein [Solirubrobacteraceae bacterium]
MATADNDAVQAPPAPREDFWDGVAHSYIPPAKLRIGGGLELHQDTSDEIDPVTYEVIRYALLHVNLEHSALIQRLCVSPITMLTRDFQTSVLTEDGELVFLGPNLQYFSNSHSLTVRWTLEHRSENPGIGPGDVYLSNDPFVGAPHQPDTTLLAPIFVDGALFCWVANTLHYSDVGGSMPGSFCIDAQDTWAEPMSWPPVKLVEDGRVRREIEELFARQSRLPHAVLTDLHAAMAAIGGAGRKLEALVERYGAPVVKTVMQRTLAASEAALAERLAHVPDGHWSHRAFTEAAVPGDRGVYAYQINVTKSGPRLIVDNRGTDPQAGSINVTYAAFAGAVLAAITQQMTADLAGAYGGVYRLVEFRPEPGLLNCADFPAAVSPSGAYTTEMQLNIAGIVVAKMLGCGDATVRELALGPCIPHFYSTVQGGIDAHGDMFIFPNVDGMMGSLGGMCERDGVDVGGHYWIPDGIASNCEDLESQYPLLILSRRLLDPGADGAGRHRGGLGFVETSVPLAAQAFQLLLYSNESFTKAQGLFGANPGTRASLRLRRDTDLARQLEAGTVPGSIDDLLGEEEHAGFKAAPLDLGPADVWQWVSPSTAGYGDPLRRDPAAVLADTVAIGLSTVTAQRVYGVVIADGKVFEDATSSSRRALLRERLDGIEPGASVDPPPGARRVGDILHVVEGRWWCNGADLGPVGANYREQCPVRETPVRKIAPEFDARDIEMADQIVFREYLCPVTGFRIDAELARAGEPVLHDISIEGHYGQHQP